MKGCSAAVHAASALRTKSRQLALVAGAILTAGTPGSTAGQESWQSLQAALTLSSGLVGQRPVSESTLGIEFVSVSENSRRIKLPVTNVDSLRRTLEAYAKVSKRGHAAIAGWLQIVDVIDAKTDAEFHNRVRRLPVMIRELTGHDAVGRDGTWKEYTHRSGRVFKSFTPNTDRPSNSQASVLLGEWSESPSQAPASEPDSKLSGSSARNSCEYTDPENVYWSGECATAQDIDDLTIYALSIEAELQGAQVEVEEAVNEYCQMLIVPDPPDEDYLEMCGGNQGGMSPFLSDVPSSQNSPFADIADEIMPNGVYNVSGARFGDPGSEVTCRPGVKCLLEKTTFSGSALYLTLRISYTLAVITAPAPPLSALAAAAAGLSLGAILVAGTNAALQNCLAN